MYEEISKRVTWTFTTLPKEQRRRNVKQVNIYQFLCFAFHS